MSDPRRETAATLIKEEIDLRWRRISEFERETIEKKALLKAVEILYAHNQHELAGKLLNLQE